MYTKDLHKIGKRLAAYRKGLGWTQAQAAEAANISEHTYSSIERGMTKMQAPTILSICTARISLNDLFLDDAHTVNYKANITEQLRSCSPHN